MRSDGDLDYSGSCGEDMDRFMICFREENSKDLIGRKNGCGSESISVQKNYYLLLKVFSLINHFKIGT